MRIEHQRGYEAIIRNLLDHNHLDSVIFTSPLLPAHHIMADLEVFQPKVGEYRFDHVLLIQACRDFTYKNDIIGPSKPERQWLNDEEIIWTSCVLKREDGLYDLILYFLEENDRMMFHMRFGHSIYDK